MTALFNQFKRFATTLLIVSFIFSSTAPALALQLNSATYSLSRHKISVSANHDLRFRTPTGIDAPADRITLTYPPGYSLAGIALGDIDFFHGATTGLETEETLAAAAAAGVWGVTIAASSISFQAPTDAGAGEIAANQFVVIRIGTNAAGGSGQITNPVAAGITNIAVTGTFGDTDVIGIPIITEDSVAVTANIAAPPPPSGGGGGGGGQGDIFPPVISNVQVINITSSTADVIWDTNESSTSLVDYGLTVAYGNQAASPGYVTKHIVSLSQLSASTTYHFKVSSKDGANNIGVSGDFIFTTLGDTTPPKIFNVQVINITDTSAQVIWNTDEAANSQVDYGTSTNYGGVVSAPSFITSHLLQLSGLKPNTLYHFFVTSKDQSSNKAVSGDATFITSPDLTAPSNVINFKAVGGDGVVHLSWTAPGDPDYAGTKIVRRTDKFPSGPSDGTVIYDGLLQLVDDTAVINGIIYYYGAFAYDTNLNFASGALASATPQGAVPQVENSIPLCSNGLDDDGDTNIDCADSDCLAFQICKPPKPTPENTNPLCSNGADDDLDGDIDCSDSECQSLPLCLAKPPIPPVPKPTPKPQGVIIEINPHFYGAHGTVELMPDKDNRLGALSGSAVYVYLPIANLGVEVEKAYITGSLYNMSLSKDGTAYEAAITVPTDGLYDISVVAEIKGGGAAVAPRQFVIQQYGRVVEEKLMGQSEEGIAAAEVTLFADQGGWVQWDASKYSQSNPLLTNADGYYAFIVPNGRYHIQVTKEGYSNYVSAPEDVVKNVVNIKAGLVKVPLPLLEAIAATGPTLEGLGGLAQNIGDQILFGLTTMRAALQRPDIQDVVENTISPALLAISLINLASALPLFNFITYLQYLFTQPILLFKRRKRKQWGVVFNSLTKQPVDLAIIRLLQAETHLVVQTMVTDKQGRFSFLVKQGNYILEAVKPGYLFPTQYLQGKTTDVDFTDLYHAAPITAQDGQVIAYNIPLDPVTRVETPRAILWRKTFRSIQQDLAFLTILAALTSLIIKPSAQVALLTLAQVGTYLLFKRLSAPIKAKEWGIVYDEKTREPLDQVIVRIFDKKFNKLLETKVTDKNGKYGFFVRRNVYYVTAEKEGYAKYVSPDIDLTTTDEGVVDQNLAIKRM